jgi:oligoribonuclease (3'-5' exoribonuclease)
MAYKNSSYREIKKCPFCSSAIPQDRETCYKPACALAGLFRAYAVTDVSTPEEFCHKYYKPDRFTGRGEEYAAVCLESHRRDYEEQGFTIMSRHESRTGEIVALYNPNWKN